MDGELYLELVGGWFFLQSSVSSVQDNKMRGFFLLISLVWGQDRPCGAGQRCVSGADCQSFRAEKLVFTRLALGSQEKLLQQEKLSSLVCNEEESRVCCDVTAGTDHDSPSYLPSLEREECGLEGGHAGFILGGDDTRLEWNTLIGREGRGLALIGRELYRTEIFYNVAPPALSSLMP